jgi:peptide/nickel transport system substrate-binding protein
MGVKAHFFHFTKWRLLVKRLWSLVLCLGLVLGCASFGTAKTFTLALDSDPVSMDPHVQLSGGMLQYSHIVFDPLVRWTKEMTIEPRLSEKWEQIDDLTFRFFLRKGVTFHSGNPLTAKDVQWTFNRLKQSDDYKGLFVPFKEVRIVDDHTFDLVTFEPYPLVLAMATYIFPMDSEFYTGTDDMGQSKDMLSKTGATFANANASGTGPFKVTHRDQGIRWEFDRFADYWDTQSPGNVTKFILTPIKNEATRTAALLSGDVDMIEPVPSQDIQRVSNSSELKLVTISGSRIITFQLNQQRRPEFQDRRVREAIVLAMDGQAIVDKIMNGMATNAGQQGPKGFAGYVEELTPRYDLEKAKALMKEAGYEDGFAVSMIAPNNRYPNDEKIAQAAVSMLAKIGIKISLKTMPKAQYWDEFDARVADIQMIGWHPDTEDSANYSEYLLMCPDTETGYGQYNSGMYCNKELDAMVLASQSELDPDKRAQILQDVERLAYEDAAFVPLHWIDLSWASKQNVGLEEIVNVMNFPYYGDLVLE